MIPQGQEDMSLFLEICDKIRGKEVSARDAMRSLKKRLGHKNPNVQLLALKLSDVCVKNGGSLFLAEVASREYMDFILQLVKQDNVNHEVKQKSLGLLQSWAFAFKNKTQLAYAVDTYNRLKSEGFSFPPVSEKTNEIMIDSSEAPEWTDSDVCERCRSLFTLTNRKHHCRNCGKTFCNSCSSQTMPLPKFGINKDVRVCDPCYATLNGRAYEAPRTPTVETGASLSKEEEELQRAIALSLLETEKNSGSSAGYVKPAPVAQKKPEDDDPELMAAIKASLKEAELQKSKSRENVSVYPTSASPPPQQRASSPPPVRHHSQGGVAAPPVVVAQNPNELSQQEQQSVALFYQLVEKIDADSTGTLAGNILNDQQLKGLHEQMTKIHPKIVKGIEECVEKHRNFSFLLSLMSRPINGVT
jgi:growth factor-regulated tyrosine kinase substrate